MEMSTAQFTLKPQTNEFLLKTVTPCKDYVWLQTRDNRPIEYDCIHIHNNPKL